MSRTLLSKNIAALRHYLGLNQGAFAERIGASQGQVSKWEGKGEEPSTVYMARLADLAGVSVKAFLGEPWVAPGASRAPDHPPTRHVDSDELVDIIQVDLAFSMGNGTTLDDYVEETVLKFDLGFVRSFTRSETSRLRLAKGVGESMSPTLLPSDLVWIDTTQNRLHQQDRIWAIFLFGAAAIKRLRKLSEDRILVISDNPAVEHQEVSIDDVIIAGRVIRFARDL